MEDYFDFIKVMYIGFAIIYLLHPEPKVFYKKNIITSCDIKNKDKICIEE